MSGPSVIDIADAYLDAWERMDGDAIAGLLHPRVEFIAPTRHVRGHKTVLDTCCHVFSAISGFTVRSSSAWGQRAMCACDIVEATTHSVCRAAKLLGVDAGRIRTIEWFYDPSPFGPMRREGGAR
jgi:hypothetical protein